MQKQNKDAEIAFFDTASSTSPWTTFNRHGQQQIFSHFEELAQPKIGETALDMGCGTGEFSVKLLEYGLLVTGIDISQKSITLCQERYKQKNLSFRVGDIEHTQLPDNSVDIIFFGGVLHHFPHREKAFQEAHRILKKGGRVFAFDPHYYNLIIWTYRELLGITTQKTENEVLLKPVDLRSELLAAGFSVVQSCGSGNITFDIRYFKKLVPFPLYYGVYLYNAIERFIHFIKPLREKHGSFVITYARK